jgi:arginase
MAVAPMRGPDGGVPVHLLVVPYDSGHRGVRMGNGPGHLAGHGAGARLRVAGHAVTQDVVELDQPFPAEIASAFALHRVLADRVRAAATAGAFPLLLAGNCNSAVGVAAGLASAGGGQGPLGVVWLDAHGDFNTPETTTGGFLDGMALAILTGRCWRAPAATVPGFRPVPDEQVLLLGGRDLDDQERVALTGSRVLWVPDGDVHDRGPAQALGPALAALAGRVGSVHLHIDLDIHDPEYAPANTYAAPGGLEPATVLEVVRLVAGRVPLAAATLAAYDPSCDVQDRMLHAGLDLVELIGGLIPSVATGPGRAR